VIVRTFHATATVGGAAAYRAHFTDAVLRSLRGIDGYQGAYLLERDGAVDEVELEVLTFWDSLEAILRFTGGDLDNAVVEPAAEAVLATYDPKVTHHAVAVADTVSH